MRVITLESVIAEHATPILLGTEYYVPPEAVDRSLLVPNGRIRFCYWKGEADTYDLMIGDTVLRDAAWCLARPFWEAMEAKGMFAFDPAQVRIET